MNQEAGDSAPKSEAGSSRPPRRPGPRRRGGRGRRRPQPRDPNLPTPTTNPAAVGSSDSVPVSEPTNREDGREETNRPPVHREQPAKVETIPQLKQRRTGSPIAQAAAQVEEIIKSLKDSLRELEEVLEILDDAQRQQIGDEKEIESLRRSLSMLQRERQSAPREEPRRFGNRGRSENRNRSEEQRSPAKSSPAEPTEPLEPTE